MSFFSFLFYLLAALSIPAFVIFFRFRADVRRRFAWTILRIYLLSIAVYATLLLATTLALPIRILHTNDPQFSGDWSITVTGIRRTPHGPDENDEIDFRLSNRDVTAIHDEKHLIVYLLSGNGTRYNPNPAPSETPFDVPIEPGKSVTTSRAFVLPANQNRLELVIAHEGFRLAWFIIGRSPLDGRTVIQLQ